MNGCIAVRLWEVSVSNRQSLLDPFVWLTSKMTQPQGTATASTADNLMTLQQTFIFWQRYKGIYFFSVCPHMKQSNII